MSAGHPATHEVRYSVLALQSPAAVRDWLRLYCANLGHEAFIMLLLNSQNRLIEAHELFHGTMSQGSVLPERARSPSPNGTWSDRKVVLCRKHKDIPLVDFLLAAQNDGRSWPIQSVSWLPIAREAVMSAPPPCALPCQSLGTKRAGCLLQRRASLKLRAVPSALRRLNARFQNRGYLVTKTDEQRR